MNAQLIESSPVEPLVVGVNLFPGDTWFREIRVVSTTSQQPVDLSAWAFTARLGEGVGTVDASRAAEGILSVTFAPSVTASAKRGTQLTIVGMLDGGRRTFVVGRVGAEVGSSIPVGLVQRKRVVQTDVDISVYAAPRGDKGADGTAISRALVEQVETDRKAAGTSAFNAGASAAAAQSSEEEAKRAEGVAVASAEQARVYAAGTVALQDAAVVGLVEGETAARQALLGTIGAVVAPNFARLDRAVEAVSLYSFGDSQGPNALGQGADAGTQSVDRFYVRHHFKEHIKRSVPGAAMGEIAAVVTSSWVANTRGLVLVCSGIGNTSTQYGMDGQASAARAFRTIMAVLTARARFPFSSTTFAFDASWTAGTSAAADALFDFGVNGDTAYLLVNTATGTGGVLEIRDGNSLVATINTGGHKAVFPGAFKISGLGSGDHILRGKLVSGSVTVVGLIIPSATPAQVAWVTVEPSRANVAQRQSYVDACAAVLADFPSAVRVTPGADWDPLLHISDEDGLHLNDRGNAYMADRIETVLAASLDFSQGLNRLTRSTAATAYAGPVPAPLVVVTTYSGDSFDRPNGALGNSEVGNKAWALSVASAVSIVDNAAEWATASATAGTIAYVDDGQATGKLTAEGVNAQSFGLWGFGDASLNGYYFFHSNGNGWRIGIRTASGFTALATAGATMPPSSAVNIALVRGANGALTGLVDGSPVVSATNTTYSGTRHGIISLVSGRRVTAWRHTDL